MAMVAGGTAPLSLFAPYPTRVFLSNSLQEALEELLWTRDIAPLEASVHKMLAEVYRKLDQPDKALRAMMMAHDLDPRSAVDPGQDAADRLDDDLQETTEVPDL